MKRPNFPKFPPIPLPWELGKTYRWRETLTPADKAWLFKELVGAGFATQKQFEKISDSDLVNYIQSDMDDAEHNGNKPWDANFLSLFRRYSDILGKLGKQIDVAYSIS